MKKVGLVLEGGAMRGLYTAGVLDTFLDNNINIDGIIGVSAGALFGVNYCSKQKGRVIRYSKRFAKDLRYMSLISLLLTGNIINKRFAFYKVTNKLDKFDDETFIKQNKEYYATITNINTGLAEYIKIDSVIKNLEVLRATSAIPIVSKPVKIKNDYYLDGALADSIPIKKCLELGYDKIIVILTRPLDYKKEELSEKNVNRVKRKYKKYPHLIKTIINRPKNYNKELSFIKELEKKKEIFVIRPSEDINIKLLERNKNNLQSVYDLGIKDSNNLYNELIKYLNN